jgi:hypothetical protein
VTFPAYDIYPLQFFNIINKQLNNFNRKMTNDLELPQYRRQSDMRTWGSPSWLRMISKWVIMMSTDVFEIRLGQNVNMYRNRLCHLLRNGFVSINTTDRIIIVTFWVAIKSCDPWFPNIIVYDVDFVLVLNRNSIMYINSTRRNHENRVSKFRIQAVVYRIY